MKNFIYSCIFASLFLGATCIAFASQTDIQNSNTQELLAQNNTYTVVGTVWAVPINQFGKVGRAEQFTIITDGYYNYIDAGAYSKPVPITRSNKWSGYNYCFYIKSNWYYFK